MSVRKQPVRRKRPVFTEKEIDVLLALIGIAGANPENEGDYRDFDYKSMDSVYEKLAVMIDKRQKRLRRENRKNKGESTEAKRQAHNARVRHARSIVGGFGMADSDVMLIASIVGKR